MNWKPTKNVEEIDKLFNAFYAKYKDEYSFMGEELIKGFMNNVGSRHCYSEFAQIYSFLDIISTSDDPYLAHFNEIKKYFDLGCNVLEVASGALPVLSTMIAKEQIKIGKGTITAYDPRLIFTNPEYSNMKLCRNIFDEKVNVSKFDLIVSLLPCTATESIITSSCKNKKDFYLAFCGCDHSRFTSFFRYFIPSYYDNIELAKSLCKENDMGDIQFVDLPDRYEWNYPIIRTEKQKKLF